MMNQDSHSTGFLLSSIMSVERPHRNNLRVGVAGWSYPDWRGLVFPSEAHFDKLEYLSQFFNTVEINNSFYVIPKEKMVQRWIESVRQNPDFLFCVKLHQQFTHGQSLQRGNPEIIPEAVEAFKQAFQPMLTVGRLGALLLQFPYRFHYQPENLDYLLRLFDAFRNYPLVVEVRHKSFELDSFYELLSQQKVAFANIDQPAVSDSMPSTRVVTTPGLAYLRLHGRNAQAWFAADATREKRYDYDYASEELDGYLDMAREFQESQGKLYVIFNNHYRASEVKNAFEFLHKVTGNSVRVMPRLLNAYPRLKRIALPETQPLRPESRETLNLFTDI
jgi:uncharacterized protein YecE (DUF72 family)